MHAIPTVSFLSANGALNPACPIQIPLDLLLSIYSCMVKTRIVDERMVLLQRQGQISFALSSMGEESAAVASAAALSTQDWLYPQYREVGALFWRGYSVQDYLHHMFGNAKDSILGRQMPNHFGSRDLNVVTVSSPIGTKIPHAAGCGYGMRLSKAPTIAVAYFGEGASSEGDFHAGLNFAAVFKTQTLFFCRNNGWAISTPSTTQFIGDGIAARGPGYGIETLRVDGNDVFAVYWATKFAKDHILQKEAPFLIEAMSYRVGPHSTSDDPSLYRSKDEVAAWQKLCPIARLKAYLIAQGTWSLSQDEELKEQINHEIIAAIDVAKSTPPPPRASLIQDVYKDVPESLRQQYDEVKRLFPEG